MLKKELRLKYSLRRNKISPTLLSDYSIDIANILLQLPIWHFNYYHIFLPVLNKKEIDTNPILSMLQGKDKNIVLPKITVRNSFLSYLLTDNTIIKSNKWGIPEPVDGLKVSPHKIDVVFIPLLAFDIYGNRVGYGKGFYDRFLKQCRSDIIKVGLSLFEPENELIADIRKEDIALNYCVTPTEIYTFQ